MLPNPSLSGSPFRAAALTFALAASSSLLFCSKGVFAKSAYLHGADPITILALFGTVLPAFLVGFSLHRSGAETYAIVGTIGPVGTVILAWIVLGEALGLLQIAGFALSLAGGFALSIAKTRSPAPLPPENPLQNPASSCHDAVPLKPAPGPKP